MLFWEAQSGVKSCINVLVCCLRLCSSTQEKNSSGGAPVNWGVKPKQKHVAYLLY